MSTDNDLILRQAVHSAKVRAVAYEILIALIQTVLCYLTVFAVPLILAAIWHGIGFWPALFKFTTIWIGCLVPISITLMLSKTAKRKLKIIDGLVVPFKMALDEAENEYNKENLKTQKPVGLN